MPARLIVRLPNWLGDTVMAVPALRAVRAGWPEASVLLAGPWAHVLAGQDLADTLVSYPRAWRGRVATADTVRAFHGELVILLPNSFEAALTAWYWGARRRVGFAVGARTLLLTERVPRPATHVHQVDEYLRLVEHLGLEIGSGVPTMTPPPAGAARTRARQLLDDSVGGATGPRVGIHLGADYGPAKLWPARRVVEACRALSGAGMVPVLLGAPRDLALADSIVAATDVTSLVGRDEPALLPALLSELDALVAGDTGVSHLAAALGTPVIALFGPTDPALTAPRGSTTVLTHPVPCAPCYYRVCPIEHPCLDGIDADRVTEAVVTALEARAVEREADVTALNARAVGRKAGSTALDAPAVGRTADGGLGGRPEPPKLQTNRLGGRPESGRHAEGGLGGRPEPPNFR